MKFFPIGDAPGMPFHAQVGYQAHHRDQRQAKDRQDQAADIPMDEIRRHTPVSYTHLDVYKRQGHTGDAPAAAPLDAVRIRLLAFHITELGEGEHALLHRCLLYTSAPDASRK